MDLLDWARSLFALIATLALILGVAYGARRLGMLQPTAQGPRRLKISESLMIDPRRRLVIVRCDGREQLMLLSPAGDVVVGETQAEAPAIVSEAPEASLSTVNWAKVLDVFTSNPVTRFSVVERR